MCEIGSRKRRELLNERVKEKGIGGRITLVSIDTRSEFGLS